MNISIKIKVILPVFLVLAGCNNSQREKEFELKEKELLLKEKELSIKENQNNRPKITTNDAVRLAEKQFKKVFAKNFRIP